jgi:HEAT repeat protein/beta-lactamase regulating signal transducer with metallopeptidase domain
MNSFTVTSMSSFVPFAGDVIIKATILLAFVSLVAHLLRRRSAALRYLLWTFAIVAIVAMPVLTAMVPFRLNVLPASAGPARVSQDNPLDKAVSSTTSLPTAAAASPLASRHDDNLAHEAPSVIASDSSPAGRRWFSFDLTTTLLIVWMVGALALLARFLVGLVTVRRIAGRAIEVTDESWHRMADRAARALGVREPVEVRSSSEVVMPFACGMRKPTIVLPVAANEWSVERREAVMMHEYAHISRGDLAMNMLSHVMRALYWIHPMAWLAAYRLRVEGERACDDAVLRAGARPSDYAEHLLSIVRSVGTTVPSVALAMARRSDFEGRLLAILEPGIPRDRLTRLRAAGLAALFLGFVMPLAAMSPTPPTPTAPLAPMLVSAPPASAPVASPAEPQEAEEKPQPQPRSQEAASAVSLLIETLSDASAAVRLAAVSSLGQLEDPRAIAALAKAMKEDTDARVRAAAAEALGNIDDARAVPHLVEALKSERSPVVREKIVSSLADIDDPSAANAVVTVLKDPAVGVRRAAVRALADFEDPNTVSALSGMVRDEDAEVRQYVAEALGNLNAVSALDALAQLTKDSNADVRTHAISALGQLEDIRALPALVAALKDPSADVRNHAADAIGDLEGVETAPRALIDAATDSNSDVRRAVAHALGHIGDAAAVPALKKMTSDSDTEVRHTAAESLKEIGGVEAMTALMALLKDPDPEIRRIAAEALGSKRQ